MCGYLSICSHHDPDGYTTVLLGHLIEALLLGVRFVSRHFGHLKFDELLSPDGCFQGPEGCV